MSTKSWQAGNRRDLIIEVWEALDCESVGAFELEQIQQVLQEKFGNGVLESPASIARILADEGAVLRHPEVFDCDSVWRERLIAEGAELESLSFSDLVRAAESIRQLESWRKQFLQDAGQAELQRLRRFVLKAKQDLRLESRSRVVDADRRAQAGEIVRWLTIWMEDPAIFEGWIDLRRRSPEFAEKFKS